MPTNADPSAIDFPARSLRGFHFPTPSSQGSILVSLRLNQVLVSYERHELREFVSQNDLFDQVTC